MSVAAPTRNVASHVIIGTACTVLGLLLGLRVYAALPERVDSLEKWRDAQDARWADSEKEMRATLILINRQLAEMQATLRRVENSIP